MTAREKDTFQAVVNKLVDLQVQLDKMPALSDLEKAKFDQSFAIDQLYYSNKLEGTILTDEDINTAIHGKRKIQAA